MNKSDLAKEALAYHSKPRPGKIEVIPSKPCDTQEELSLAYTPGVAVPCLEIEKTPEDAYLYTNKGNLVAVLTNGSAVLGLGNIGALSGKPVMEGKGVLFKIFAGIDVFDIELNTQDPQEIIKACKLLEPTFGGINLEDIKAPECFIVEEELKKSLKIPVFHDDQHGTAIIAGAALLNALDIVGKKIDEAKLVINGAGASGLAIAALLVTLGVKKENLIMCDSKGVIYKGRTEGMNKYKEKFAADTDKRTLSEAVKNCDVLYGLSKKGAFSEDMIKSMAKDPVIFAMANPDPEITPEEVRKIRKDAVMATGRSDYPNQVNNVLCFPFLFRGALDVRASVINEEMKVAASRAIASLARQSVPQSVCKAYGVSHLEFGPDYILPKPFDPRVLTSVSIAVAKAAMDSGVAGKPIKDLEAYKTELEERLDPSKALSAAVKKGADKNVKIGMTWADKPNILAAAFHIAENGMGKPVVIGTEEDIAAQAAKMGKDLSNITVIDPAKYKNSAKMAEDYYETFWRSGLTKAEARKNIYSCLNRFAANLLRDGVLDCLVAFSPVDKETTVQAVADFIDLEEDYYNVSFSAVVKNAYREFIICDPVLAGEETSDDLTELAELAVKTAKLFGIEPRVAFINDTDFGSKCTESSSESRMAAETFKFRNPEIRSDGDMAFGTAVDPSAASAYPLSDIKGDATVLVFSNGGAANAAYKAMSTFGGFKTAALVLQGFEKPVQIVGEDTESWDVVTAAMVASACFDKKNKK